MQAHRVSAIWSFHKLELLEKVFDIVNIFLIKWEDLDNENASISNYPFYIA